MNEATAYWKDVAATLPGPYRAQPARDVDFVPLRFWVTPQKTRVDVTQPDVVVGRHSLAEVRLADPDVSRRHCRLALTDGLWRVQDLNSLNGVYLNGQRIQEAVLVEGDCLRLGGCTMLVEQAPAPVHVTNDDAGADMLQSIAEAILPPSAARQAAG